MAKKSKGAEMIAKAKITFTPTTPLAVIVKGKDVFVGKLKHTPTKAQELMIADGAPRDTMLSEAQRALLRSQLPPPAAMPKFAAPMREEGEDTKRFRAQIEAQEASKKAERFAAFRASRPKRTPRPSREGLIAVADIAKEFNIIPRVARGHLRAAKYPKPAHGWAFTPEQAQQARTIIQKGQSSCRSLSPTTKASKRPSTPPAKRSTKSSRVSTASSKPKKSKRSSKKGTSSTRSHRPTAKRSK